MHLDTLQKRKLVPSCFRYGTFAVYIAVQHERTPGFTYHTTQHMHIISIVSMGEPPGHILYIHSMSIQVHSYLPNMELFMTSLSPIKTRVEWFTYTS